MVKDKRKRHVPRDEEEETPDEVDEVEEAEESQFEDDDYTEEGGNVEEDYEQEDEEVLEEEGYEDEDFDEEGEAREYRKMKRKRAMERERRMRRAKGRNRAVVAAVIVLILVGTMLWYIFYGPAKIAAVTVTTARITGDRVDVIATLDVDSGVAAGNANMHISLNDTEVYSSTIQISENRGHLVVDYSDFVMKNGEYDVEVTFQGKTGRTEFNVNTVAERLDLIHGNITNKGNVEKNFIFTTMGFDPELGKESAIASAPGEMLKVTIQGPAGAALGPFDMGENLESTSQYGVEYKFTKWGNYTVRAEFTNLNVTSDSPYRTIVHEEPFFINADPVASVFPTTQTIHLLIMENGKAQIDLSATWDDGPITTYMADFGEYNDPQKDETWNSQDLVVSSLPHLEYTYTTYNGPEEHMEVVVTVIDEYGKQSSTYAEVIVNP